MVTNVAVRTDIRDRLAVAQLPALPAVLLQILQLCTAEDSGLGEIVEVVRRDAAVTARILSIARSPYYNRGHPPKDLGQCLQVLGTRTVRRIALNQAVLDLFSRFQVAAKADLTTFWVHALLTALLAQQLAERLVYPHVEEAYLAGLLHDIGRLALLAGFSEDYASLFAADMDEQLLLQAERARFDLDHAEVGAWLAQRWQLDLLFSDSLRYHHASCERVADAHPLVRIVALAEQLSSTRWAANRAEACGLESAEAEAMLAHAIKELREIADQFGILLPELPSQAATARATDEEMLARLAQAASNQLLVAGILDDEPCPAGIAQVYQALVRGAQLVFGTHAATLFLPDDAGLRGASPDRRDARVKEIHIRLPATDSVIGRAHGGRVEILRQRDAGASLADMQVCRLLGADALLCLPLAHAGRAMGVLVLDTDAAEATALEDKKALLTAYAAQAGYLFHAALTQAEAGEAARQSLAEEFLLRAREVIHEVANPLGVVQNYLAILRDRVTHDAESVQEIDLMREELRRVSGMLQTLRSTQPMMDSAVATVDINALLQQVVDFCRKGKPELARIETVFHLDADLRPVTVDRDKLKQVLINVIFNAVEAMPKGGRLSLSTARWCIGRGEERVEISIEDTGPGIPDAVLQQLYTPVVSHKGGHHAGLGLSIVGRLVDELGAVIQCHSTAAGTRFKLVLPYEANSREEG